MLIKFIFGFCSVALATMPTSLWAEDIEIFSANIQNGYVVLSGRASPNANLTWDGASVGSSNGDGVFAFQFSHLPDDCIGQIDDGNSSKEVVISNCGPAGPVGPQGSTGLSGWEADSRTCAEGIPGGVCFIACSSGKSAFGGSCSGGSGPNARNGFCRRGGEFGFCCFGDAGTWDDEIRAQIICAEVEN